MFPGSATVHDTDTARLKGSVCSASSSPPWPVWVAGRAKCHQAPARQQLSEGVVTVLCLMSAIVASSETSRAKRKFSSVEILFPEADLDCDIT